MEDDAAWDLIDSVYCIGGSFEQWDATDEAAARKALETVKELAVGQLVLDLALESVWTALRREIVPVFWRTVCAPTAGQESDTALLTRFHDALQLLQNSVVVLAPLIHRCEEVCAECRVQYRESVGCSVEQVMMVQLRATLHSQMPDTAPRTLRAIYHVAFRIYMHMHLSQYKLSEDNSLLDSSLLSVRCSGCFNDNTDCQCSTLSSTFHDINRVTWRVGVAYELCSAVAAGQLVEAVQQRVAAACALPHDTHRLQHLYKWLKVAALGWLTVVGAPDAPAATTSHPLYRSCHTLLIRTFLNIRIKNLFSIVIDYPESRPAIEDLRSCLQHVDVHQHLVKTLRNSIKSRMLHPGVKTLDVLHAYISIIKALRVLEPRGVILDIVTEPVRTYLRSRRDFVRYIVTSLTDGGSLELSEDLIESELAADEPPDHNTAVEEWRQWTPDTIYARDKPKKCSESSSNDLISMLVDIYGSKDMFISEYRALFADRLLTNLDCSKASVETETKHLEQIKKRFGTSSPYISKIEVMIRDMNVSRTINSAAQELYSEAVAAGDDERTRVACMIVSGLFWPAFKEESIELPERAQEYIKQYNELFTKLKPNRKLSWKPHLGQVELEIELRNRTLDLRVSPGHATVLMAFEEKPRLTLQEITLEAKTTSSTVRKLVSFWVGQGVLKEVSPDVYEVCEDGVCKGSGSAGLAPPPAAEDDAESAMAPSEVQRDEELEVLWSYILGMLTNLESLPLTRIHSMLTMFVDEGMQCSMEEIKALLDQKVMQHLLIMVNGQYKLNNN
uniref:Anaphase-promoting complex subunit 2 n=1 Tax=Hirondellea gigas TaxID=1518452 RepID=A0A2P2I5F3_9CRUS